MVDAKRLPLPPPEPEHRPIRFTVVEGSASWDAYEHQPDHPPRRLIGLVNPTAEVVPCACGGELVIRRKLDEHEITSSIQTHQLTAEHLAWREKVGIE